MAGFPIGIHLPPNEDDTGGLRLADMAELAESAGFESLWVSDHTALIAESKSRYPFSETGEFMLPPDANWYDWVVVLSYLAARTTTLRLGVGVAVVPHRHPIVLAKQLATLDQLSNGRVIFGAGVGWLAEEFAALGVPFSARGARTDASIDLIRAAWTGAPPAGTYGPFEIPPGVHTRPVPVQARLPILIGGGSAATLRRAVTRGDGWFGAIAGGRMSPEHLAEVVRRLRTEADKAGRDFAEIDVSLRVSAPAREVFTQEYADYLHRLIDAGATRLTFDIGWRNAQRAADILHRLRTVVDAR